MKHHVNWLDLATTMMIFTTKSSCCCGGHSLCSYIERISRSRPGFAYSSFRISTSLPFCPIQTHIREKNSSDRKHLLPNLEFHTVEPPPTSSRKLQCRQILAGFRELAFLHTLTHIVVDEGSFRVPSKFFMFFVPFPIGSERQTQNSVSPLVSHARNPRNFWF